MLPPPRWAEVAIITLPLQEYLTTVVSLDAALEEIRRMDAIHQSVKP